MLYNPALHISILCLLSRRQPLQHPLDPVLHSLKSVECLTRAAVSCGVLDILSSLTCACTASPLLNRCAVQKMPTMSATSLRHAPAASLPAIKMVLLVPAPSNAVTTQGNVMKTHTVTEHSLALPTQGRQTEQHAATQHRAAAIWTTTAATQPATAGQVPA
jgi:hypothetical protein